MNLIKIEFFRSSSGRNYVQDFIESLNKSDEEDILSIFKGIEFYGFNTPRCSFRQIEGKLWEIKIRTAGGSWTFFYVMFSADLICILHAYKKQGQKAPVKELEVARKRLKEVLK